MTRHLCMLAAALGAVTIATDALAQPGAGSATRRIMPGPAPDYSRPGHWLCRPNNMTTCATNVDATVISAAGDLSIERWSPATNTPIDCFYVYPTASLDSASNSDLVPGTRPGEEVAMAETQFARFASVCRLYAPMYRSRTVAAVLGQAPPGDAALAYADIAKAWAHYLAHDNQGRGFVLIGHSQGAALLRELIKKQIDGQPIQAQLVSALLIGTDIGVEPGSDKGGDFKSVPICSRNGQTGCVISYNSYRADSPPQSNSRVGKARTDGLQEVCVNPAAVSGGPAKLDAYLQTRWRGAGRPSPPKPWTIPAKPIATEFVKLPGLLSGECLSDSNGAYLAVTVNADPTDGRVDEIQGDYEPNGQPLPEWGLHMIDVDLAMGNLIRLVGDQGRIWKKAQAAGPPLSEAKP